MTTIRNTIRTIRKAPHHIKNRFLFLAPEPLQFSRTTTLGELLSGSGLIIIVASLACFVSSSVVFATDYDATRTLFVFFVASPVWFRGGVAVVSFPLFSSFFGTDGSFFAPGGGHGDSRRISVVRFVSRGRLKQPLGHQTEHDRHPSRSDHRSWFRPCVVCPNASRDHDGRQDGNTQQPDRDRIPLGAQMPPFLGQEVKSGLPSF